MYAYFEAWFQVSFPRIKETPKPKFDLLTIFLHLKFQLPISQNGPMRLVPGFVGAGHIYLKSGFHYGPTIITESFLQHVLKEPGFRRSSSLTDCRDDASHGGSR